MQRNRVVITGLGILAANGVGKEAFWDSLLNGYSGVRPITLFDASDLPCRIAGEITSFDPREYLDPALKPRRMSRGTQMGITATQMALQDAHLELGQLRQMEQLPIVIGVATNSMDFIKERINIFSATAHIPHAAASGICYALKLNARMITLSNGCASSLDAVCMGSLLIQSGQADLVICGGAESAITRYVMEGMIKSGAVSTNNAHPQSASRPFDLNRDGGIVGEGAGIVILENLQHARARDCVPYAEIKGFASSADPVGSMEGGGFGNAMKMALRNAGKHPHQINMINAHAPSDPHMDKMETNMIKEVFLQLARQIPVTSIKGATANPMGTVGVHQIITSALCIRHGLIPPVTNYEIPDPACDLDCVHGNPRRNEVRSVLVNSHGFGRGNSSVILDKVA